MNDRNPFKSEFPPSLVTIALELWCCPPDADVDALLREAGYDLDTLEEWVQSDIHSALSIIFPLTPLSDRDERAYWEERLETLFWSGYRASMIPSRWAAHMAQALSGTVIVALGALEEAREG